MHRDKLSNRADMRAEVGKRRSAADSNPGPSPLSLAPWLVAVLLPIAGVQAQSFRRGGTEFNAMRPVSVPSGKAYTIVVTEFFHHGEIHGDGRNVIVSARNQDLVPRRVLQLGPGDFCRLAFQGVPRQTAYEIFYGGDPPKEDPPPWTSRDGLLLETRHYKQCNVNQLDSVRNAFNTSKPFGSDYVEAVQHASNPFSLKPAPFLSRYSGQLQIPSAGTYGFLTSSRDCSFLLIDGKEVVSAPGRHGPARRALRGSRKDVQLSAGRHKFEYYHAATGPAAVMVAAWEISPTEEKPKPAAIPPAAFRTGAVGRLPAGNVTLRTRKLVPDFTVKIAGDVPLPDNNLPLIGVNIKDTSAKALTMRAKLLWDFGDGQSSERPNVDHVYLRPGIYTLKLSVKRGGRTVEMVNRINIDRPALTVRDRAKFHKLDDYLPILESYTPETLDAVALRQLVLAYEAKALALQAPPEEQSKPPGDAEVNAPDAKPYFAAAVAAGKVAFLGESAARDGDVLHQLAKLIGPMARNRLGQSKLALQIYHRAAERIGIAEVKAECEIEAADVAVNDLVDAAAAKKLLDAATRHLGPAAAGAVAGELQRVWGDYYALAGKGKEARQAYKRAEQLLSASQGYSERTAWRGAHSRSTEEFIKQGQLDRAAGELRAWQREFPTEKIDGYLTLLYARYWLAREKYAQAVAQAEQLQAVNADSPYADRLLLLAAECEVKQNRTDRALATLHALLKDYPGSPLVDQVKKRITQLEANSAPP